MKYLSVCSGIEAATVAWHGLAWQSVAFSEIEPFPKAVLAHHYPETPNWGDMTKFQRWPDVAIELLVGGTPCQGFSVAGLRGGMDDARSQLSLAYAGVARRYRPTWLVWENVPGVLSSNAGRDFAEFLGLLSGQNIEVPTEGWKSAGIVPGIERSYGLAWRVLDAQYFGVPQRRRRVFVVGYLGDWRCAATVLFESESMHGYSPPCREKRQEAPSVSGTLSANGGGTTRPAGNANETDFCVPVGPTISARTNGGGGLGTDFDLDGGLIANAVTTKGGHRADTSRETYVTHSLRAEGCDASEDGTGRGTPIIPTIAFSSKDLGGDATEELSPPLRAGGSNKSHANAGIPPAVAFGIPGNWIGRKPENGGNAVQPMENLSPNLTSTDQHAVAFEPGIASREGGHVYEEVSRTLRKEPGDNQMTLIKEMQVRRLTPRECERLQGFPDDYTLIKRGGKPAADGPRYKSLGNSMAVPVMRWIGERITKVQKIKETM